MSDCALVPGSVQYAGYGRSTAGDGGSERTMADLGTSVDDLPGLLVWLSPIQLPFRPWGSWHTTTISPSLGAENLAAILERPDPQLDARDVSCRSSYESTAFVPSISTIDGVVRLHSIRRRRRLPFRVAVSALDPSARYGCQRRPRLHGWPGSGTSGGFGWVDGLTGRLGGHVLS